MWMKIIFNLSKSCLQEEDETVCILANNDPKEIQLFYQKFYEENILGGEHKKKPWGLILKFELLTCLNFC